MQRSFAKGRKYVREDVRKLFKVLNIEIDPDYLAQSDPSAWDDLAVLLALVAKEAVVVANQVKNSITIEAVRDFTVGVLQSAAEYVVGLDDLAKLKKLTRATRRKKEKMARALFEGFSKHTNNANNLLVMLKTAGVIGGGATTVAVPAMAAVVAFLAWGGVAFATVSVIRAARGYYSPSYLFEDKLTQYNNIDKKINSLYQDIAEFETERVAAKDRYFAEKENIQTKLNATIEDYKKETEKKTGKDDSVLHRLEEEVKSLVKDAANLDKRFNKASDKREISIATRQREIENWIDEQEKLKKQAIALAQVDNARPKQRISPELREKFEGAVGRERAVDEAYRKQTNKLSNKQFKKLMEQKKPSPENIELVKQLKKNQRDMVIGRSIVGVACTLVAVGSTLIAISPACAHGAPAVALAGSIIAGLGAGVLGLKVGLTWSFNKIAKLNSQGEKRQNLLALYGISPWPKGTARLQLGYRLSFEHHQKKIGDVYGYYLRSVPTLPAGETDVGPYLEKGKLYVEHVEGKGLRYHVIDKSGNPVSGIINTEQINGINGLSQVVTTPLKVAELEKYMPELLKITSDNGHTKSEAELKKMETEWRQTVNRMPEKEREKLLKNAEKKGIEDKVLCDILKVQRGSDILDDIPGKARTRIVYRGYRNKLGRDMKAGLIKGYHATKEAVVSASSTIVASSAYAVDKIGAGGAYAMDKMQAKLATLSGTEAGNRPRSRPVVIGVNAFNITSTGTEASNTLAASMNGKVGATLAASRDDGLIHNSLFSGAASRHLAQKQEEEKEGEGEKRGASETTEDRGRETRSITGH